VNCRQILWKTEMSQRRKWMKNRKKIVGAVAVVHVKCAHDVVHLV